MVIEKVQAISLDKATAEKYIEILINNQYHQPTMEIKYLGGGSFGSAYLVNTADKSFVIKFLRAKDMLEKEVFDLHLLMQTSPIKFPKILFTHKKDDIIPIDCYGMDLIDDKSVFFDYKSRFKSRKARKNFADQVTTALHEIHLKTSDKFGNTMLPIYDKWLDFYKPFAKAIFDKAEELFEQKELPKKVINAMRSAWQHFDSIFDEEVTAASLIHGDLNISNIMVNDKFEITGFIDPLNSMYADREYDLFQFDNMGGKRFYLRKTYIQKYGASKNCDAKCAFYALWNEVYCFIKAGTLFNFIMNPLIKNMYKNLKKL